MRNPTMKKKIWILQVQKYLANSTKDKLVSPHNKIHCSKDKALNILF